MVLNGIFFQKISKNSLIDVLVYVFSFFVHNFLGLKLNTLAQITNIWDGINEIQGSVLYGLYDIYYADSSTCNYSSYDNILVYLLTSQEMINHVIQKNESEQSFSLLYLLKNYF